jgi:hypothetical protein
VLRDPPRLRPTMVFLSVRRGEWSCLFIVQRAAGSARRFPARVSSVVAGHLGPSPCVLEGEGGEVGQWCLACSALVHTNIVFCMCFRWLLAVLFMEVWIE